jgi:hypothetical protein
VYARDVRVVHADVRVRATPDPDREFSSVAVILRSEEVNTSRVRSGHHV